MSVKIQYGKMGVSINQVEVSKKEVNEGLKKIDNDSIQMARIKFIVNGKVIYLYNDKFSGKKNISLEYIDNIEAALGIACQGKAKSFLELNQEIKQILKEK